MTLQLRQDLTLVPGPPSEDGSPGWLLHDTAANRFYRMPAEEVEMLHLIELSKPELIAQAASNRLGRPVAPERAMSFLTFLARHDLLQPGSPAALKALAAKAKMAGKRDLAWLAKNYLFLRIPLLRPDRALDRMMPWMHWWFHRWTNWVIGALVVTGLLLVFRQIDVFLAVFPRPTDPGDLAWFGLGLFAVKGIHEFAHAITAKRMGCRVPSLGVTLLVFVPVLYTDTSDVWRLTSRRARMSVAFAGIKAELALASLCLVAWALLPDGPLRGLAQALATTNWVLTLMVNLNPLMRFDGYYLLADGVGIDNLQPRAVALAQWWLREKIADLGDAPPEPPRPWMVAYGAAVQAYRISLTFSIAVGVYALVFKTLGMILITAHIGLFVLLPLIKEAKALWKRRAEITDHRRLKISGAVGLVLLLLFVPWRSTITAPAVLKANRSIEVYAPADGRLAEPPPPQGTRIEAGKRILRLETPDLSAEISRLQAKVASLAWQSSAGAFDQRLLGRNPVVEAELHAARARMDGLTELVAKADVFAPFAGIVADVQTGLRPGDWLGEGEPLLTLVNPSAWEVVAYLLEEDLDRISVGMTASFRTPSDELLAAEVVAIDPASLRELDTRALASTYGGPLQTRQGEGGSAIPLRALYRVHLKVKVPAQRVDGAATVGVAGIEGHFTSPAGRLLTRAGGVLRRELGF